MADGTRPLDATAQQCEAVDRRNVHILVVDSHAASRTEVMKLLKECSYQVTGVRTKKEAMQVLWDAVHSNPVGAPDGATFDLIVKVVGDHDPPPGADAVRLLRYVAKYSELQQIPVVVVSSQYDPDMMVQCLGSGAIDYLVKPLRRNELQLIWKHVRRFFHLWQSNAFLAQSLQQQFAPQLVLPGPPSATYSTDSKETQCIDEQDPASKEGSAPVGTGSGRNGSKEGNNGSGTLDLKTGHGSNNGNSGDNGNGINSGSKNGNRGSNGNGCSTSRMAVAGSGNQPAGEGHHHPFQIDLNLASEAGQTNGNGHGSNNGTNGNGHGSNQNGNGSGDNGNGNSGNGGTGQSTVQSQQQIGRPEGAEMRDSEVPTSRGPVDRDYVSAQGDRSGFHQWANASKGQLSGNKRMHSELAQAGSAQGTGRAQRHASRLPLHSNEPTDGPQSNPYEASGTGHTSCKPALPTPQSHHGSGAPQARAGAARGSFETRLGSEGTATALAPACSGPPSGPELRQHAGAGAGAGQQVHWQHGSLGMGPPGSSHRLQASVPKPEAVAKPGLGGRSSMLHAQPPQHISRQQAEPQAAVQQQAPPFGAANPYLNMALYASGGNPMAAMAAMGGWPGPPPGWGQGPYQGGQTQLDAQKMAFALGLRQGSYATRSMDIDGANAAANAAMQQQQQQQAAAAAHMAQNHWAFMPINVAAGMPMPHQLWAARWGAPPPPPSAFTNDPHAHPADMLPAAHAVSAKPRSASTSVRSGPSSLHDTGMGSGKKSERSTGLHVHPSCRSAGKSEPHSLSLEPPRKGLQHRAASLQRYKEKKAAGAFNGTKKVRYEKRKDLADARPRVKGQFTRTKPQEEADKGDTTTNGTSALPASPEQLLFVRMHGGRAGPKNSAEERAAAKALQGLGFGTAAMEDPGYDDDVEYDDDSLERPLPHKERLHALGHHHAAQGGHHTHHAAKDTLQQQLHAGELGQSAGAVQSQEHRGEAPGARDGGVASCRDTSAHVMRSGQGSGGLQRFGHRQSSVTASYGVDSNRAHVGSARSNGEGSNGRNGRGGSDSGSNSPDRRS